MLMLDTTTKRRIFLCCSPDVTRPLTLGLTDPGESVGCYNRLASGSVEIKESPFSMSESQIHGVSGKLSGKLGSTLAKIS